MRYKIGDYFLSRPKDMPDYFGGYHFGIYQIINVLPNKRDGCILYDFKKIVGLSSWNEVNWRQPNIQKHFVKLTERQVIELLLKDIWYTRAEEIIL